MTTRPTPKKRQGPLATQVEETLVATDGVPTRPTPEDVMGALDLREKVADYLLVAATAWLTADHHDAGDRQRYEGAHHVELGDWDEHGAHVSFFPRMVNDYDYREWVTVPMSDLLPDFAQAWAVLDALR